MKLLVDLMNLIMLFCCLIFHPKVLKKSSEVMVKEVYASDDSFRRNAIQWCSHKKTRDYTLQAEGTIAIVYRVCFKNPEGIRHIPL